MLLNCEQNKYTLYDLLYETLLQSLLQTMEYSMCPYELRIDMTLKE